MNVLTFINKPLSLVLLMVDNILLNIDDKTDNEINKKRDKDVDEDPLDHHR